MIKPKLIADSGGTKTDWCFVDEQGEKQFFTTESYHPRSIDDLDLISQRTFWDSYSSIENLELLFFGAGCLSPQNQQKMIDFFQKMGFKNCSVQSDILAAGYALNGGEGWGAICGTGSVAFHMSNKKLIKLQGGLGRDLGDEGSGYYFGKLIASKLVSGQLRHDEVSALAHLELSPENYSKIPHLLSAVKDKEVIREIHKENISLFVKAYLDGCQELSFCGSYAFHHQEIFKETLQYFGIRCISFIERPIEKLVDFLLE